jgi:hypothetical protein
MKWRYTDEVPNILKVLRKSDTSSLPPVTQIVRGLLSGLTTRAFLISPQR